jgi:hypothetical protein
MNKQTNKQTEVRDAGEKKEETRMKGKREEFYRGFKENKKI